MKKENLIPDRYKYLPLVNKQELLKYGLQKRHFTIEEYCWCLNGNNIKDYEEKIYLPIEKFLSSSLETEFDTEEMLLNVGALG